MSIRKIICCKVHFLRAYFKENNLSKIMLLKIYGFEVFDEINLCKLLYIILIPAGEPYM